MSSIRELKLGKSSGPDGIGAEFYINTSYEIAPFLKDLYNNIFNSGIFPPAWGIYILKLLDEAGRQTWASKVRSLLYKYGFGYVWVAQEVGNVFIEQFKLRLTDCMKQTWHSDINESPRCDSYKEFKTLLNVE